MRALKRFVTHPGQHKRTTELQKDRVPKKLQGHIVGSFAQEKRDWCMHYIENIFLKLVSNQLGRSPIVPPIFHRRFFNKSHVEEFFFPSKRTTVFLVAFCHHAKTIYCCQLLRPTASSPLYSDHKRRKSAWDFSLKISAKSHFSWLPLGLPHYWLSSDLNWIYWEVLNDSINSQSLLLNLVVCVFSFFLISTNEQMNTFSFSTKIIVLNVKLTTDFGWLHKLRTGTSKRWFSGCVNDEDVNYALYLISRIGSLCRRSTDHMIIFSHLNVPIF